MKKGISIIACCALLWSACTSGRVGPDEYMNELDKSGSLKKVVTAGAYEYTFRVSTPEAMALKDCYQAESGRLDTAAYGKRKQELQDYVYVCIDQRVKGKEIPVLQYNLSGYSEYEERVKYYEFYAINDVRMLCNGREIKPASCQYENHLGLSPANTLVVVFPRCGESGDWQVCFNDRGLNNLFLKANFSQKDINELPQLVLN